MIKVIRLIALAVLLAVAFMSTPVMACFQCCPPTCTYGCKFLGLCAVCCTQGTPDCYVPGYCLTGERQH